MKEIKQIIKKEGLRLVKFELNNGLFLDSLVECYRDAFAWLPWQEWKLCLGCEKKFGKEEENFLMPQLRCPICQQPLVDFWEPKKVKKDIKNELNRLMSSCYLLVEENSEKVVGFTWGYAIEAKELEKHLKLPGVAERLKKHYPAEKLFVYQDEIGLHKNYQGKKLGKVLFLAHVLDFVNQGLNISVVRTKTLPPTVTYPWYKRIGYKVIQKYNDADGRVILTANFSELKYFTT